MLESLASVLSTLPESNTSKTVREALVTHVSAPQEEAAAFVVVGLETEKF